MRVDCKMFMRFKMKQETKTVDGKDVLGCTLGSWVCASTLLCLLVGMFKKHSYRSCLGKGARKHIYNALVLFFRTQRDHAEKRKTICHNNFDTQHISCLSPTLKLSLFPE